MALGERNSLHMHIQHPVYVLKKIWLKGIVIIAALLPLVFADVPQSVTFSAVAVDAALLFSGMLIAVIMRYGNSWSDIGREMIFCRGVLSKRKEKINKNDIVIAKLVKTPLTAMFNTVSLSLGTMADGNKEEKISIYEKANVGEGLVRSIFAANKPDFSFSPKTSALLLSAAVSSNFFNGVLIMIPFIYQLGRILGFDIPARLYGDVSKLFSFMLPFIPRAFSGLSLLLIIGWSAHFVVNCFLLGNFTSAGDRHNVAVLSGVIRRQLVNVKMNAVSCVEIKSTLLMLLFKRRTVTLFVRGSKCVNIMPACTIREAKKTEGQLVPSGHYGVKATVGEKGKVSWWLPWVFSDIALLLIWLKAYLTQAVFLPAVSWICLVLIVPISVRAVLCSICVNKAYLEVSGRYLTLYTVNRLSIIKRKFFIGRISEIRTTQNIFQKGKSLCTVVVKARGVGKTKCKNLPIDRAQALIDRIK